MARLRDIDAALDDRFDRAKPDYPQRSGALAIALLLALEALEDAGLDDEAADVLRRLAGRKKEAR